MGHPAPPGGRLNFRRNTEFNCSDLDMCGKSSIETVGQNSMRLQQLFWVHLSIPGGRLNCSNKWKQAVHKCFTQMASIPHRFAIHLSGSGISIIIGVTFFVGGGGHVADESHHCLVEWFCLQTRSILLTRQAHQGWEWPSDSSF